MATMELRQRARLLLVRSLSGRAPSRWSADVAGRCSVMASSSLKLYCPLGRGPGMRSFSRSASEDRLPPFGSSACGLRGFSAGASVEEDYSQEVDEINLKFAEAREEIDAALESKDTVYFNEEADCAREAVKEVLDLFDGLLAKLPEKNRGVLRRSMGLKMEQLKAELEQLKD